MQEEKRKVWKLTVSVCMILLLCTILSGWINELMLPQVVIFYPFSGKLSGTEEDTYKCLIPVSGVYTDSEGSYVFRIKEDKDGFKVERCSVKILASDNLYAAVYGYLHKEDGIAVYPSRELMDGESVKVGE